MAGRKTYAGREAVREILRSSPRAGEGGFGQCKYAIEDTDYASADTNKSAGQNSAC